MAWKVLFLNTNCFDCPICRTLMTAPIYLCQVGHSFCCTCLTRMRGCPLCRTPFTGTRNYALESLTQYLVFVESEAVKSKKDSPVPEKIDLPPFFQYGLDRNVLIIANQQQQEQAASTVEELEIQHSSFNNEALPRSFQAAPSVQEPYPLPPFRPEENLQQGSIEGASSLNFTWDGVTWDGDVEERYAHFQDAGDVYRDRVPRSSKQSKRRRKSLRKKSVEFLRRANSESSWRMDFELQEEFYFTSSSSQDYSSDRSEDSHHQEEEINMDNDPTMCDQDEECPSVFDEDLQDLTENFEED